MFAGAPFATAPFASLGNSIFFVFINESAVAVDQSVVAGSQFNAILSELANALDATAADNTISVSVLEASQISEFVATFPEYPVQVTESATAQDQVEAQANFAVLIAELGIASDSPSARLLWELINDTQTVAWQNIPAQSATSWQSVDTSVGTSWIPIETTP